MKTACLTALSCLIACALAHAQVLVTDYGVQTSIAGPGAPAHIIGLQRISHVIAMDTGVKAYGLQYTIAHDDKRPDIAIPGEGYIGMSQPSGQNWYGGGFFDLQINGQTIGATRIHSLTSRSVGDRGYADFVFDTALSVVRIRFVTLANSDALYCQALLEPKTEIKSLRVVVRCYPSDFVSNGDRHVLTPVRDIAQGEKVELNLGKECWLLYYDRIYDAGYTSPGHTGVGPCSALWVGSQADKVGFTVGGYGIDTAMTLKPQLRDFRFVFFDHAGQRNDAAMASLRARGETLQQELSTFVFTDPTIAGWSLTEKQAEIQKWLAAVPGDKEFAARYEQWRKELSTGLKAIQSGEPGAIMAEANAARIISEWERGVPELRLKALLNGI
ncbi:MAG: hypothetical protein AUJ92_08085 [Armatimonadetes bacterium CG2_30_59_28]|nr:hypothetical protein [Armatimonadota bacterium]OIO95360.1 MAG: hypothetical protein AUJ92_08085 [Armatimonadetes bacterium CG2_30_59_28]PIU64461.1 MAG: hypothetical protein COS85_12285 [Armatimonadetes bacterium CG07_land_8_20_14_0_80_59_28]PIX38725.1 MAG: hypothetical protein COZ56_19700 [Armatimonadetes bacterium CG_4_8_14_3_um_filter_58_9]PIY44613.1 MAG: hypothetical protein COZ05_07695 [Armatimonadetes bacterium CG_4_10_14_3_um_filter_59_10]PJB74466.1 MAG: hypothetical protein CO095_047